MKNKLQIIGGILVLLICFSANKKEATPPGTVRIKDNLYFDTYEISNKDWQEYVSWNKSTYGKESKNYIESLPDTTVWEAVIHYDIETSGRFYSHSAFSDYPVVGISYEQAKQYCEWRSDRLNKQLPNAFKCRLPTKEEWEYVAKIGLSEKVLKKINKQKTKQTSQVTNLAREGSIKRDANGLIYGDFTTPVKSYYPNQLGIYNIIGNVAEMIDEKGIAKGGSFMQSEEESTPTKDINYKKPEIWIGFRCVCEKIEN